MEMIHAEKLLPRVQAVETRPGYELIVTFTNGEKKSYNAAHLLQYPAFNGLDKLFSFAQVAFGTVVWPNDMDIDPDTLYLKGKPI